MEWKHIIINFLSSTHITLNQTNGVTEQQRTDPLQQLPFLLRHLRHQLPLHQVLQAEPAERGHSVAGCVSHTTGYCPGQKGDRGANVIDNSGNDCLANGSLRIVSLRRVEIRRIEASTGKNFEKH